MKKVLTVVVVAVLMAGAFAVGFFMKPGAVQKEDAPVPVAVEKSDMELVKDCLMGDPFPSNRDDINVVALKDGWAFGTVYRELSMSSPYYFLCKKGDRGWSVFREGSECWNREKILSQNIPDEVMKEIEAAGRIPEELEELVKHLISNSDVTQEQIDAGEASIDIDWIDSGWALGGLTEKEGAGFLFIAKKEKGEWDIPYIMQESMLKSDVEELDMPKSVVDRLMEGGYIDEGESVD